MRARVRQSLRAAGVDEEDGEAAQELAADEAAVGRAAFRPAAADRPFRGRAPDRAGREKALAAMVRAGHGFELARAVVDAEPGSES